MKKIDFKKDPAALPKMRYKTFHEGKAVQIMHIGPYDQVEEDIEKLQAFAAGKGLEITGKHHELYLSDPRRTASEKLKTVLRHPVK